jgi:hypothetical protein
VARDLADGPAGDLAAALLEPRLGLDDLVLAAGVRDGGALSAPHDEDLARADLVEVAEDALPLARLGDDHRLPPRGDRFAGPR